MPSFPESTGMTSHPAFTRVDLILKMNCTQTYNQETPDLTLVQGALGLTSAQLYV
jgi:hypothetical protein